MAPHWTYETAAPAKDLEQGDILEPSQELREVLTEVHPRFSGEKYLGFIVTTQSCDLVRRGGAPKARYISIATVRSLKQVFPRLAETVARPVAPRRLRKSSQVQVRQLLERLLDQNEQGLGLFYLHPDDGAGLGEPAVAFLRVNVALRDDHYDVLLSARKGRLTPEFRAKFGWLVGNLYSRAATRDWADDPLGKSAAAKLVEEIMTADGLLWLDDALVDAAGKDFDYSERDNEALLQSLSAYQPKPAIKQAAEEVVKEYWKVLKPRLEKLRESQRARLAEVRARAEAVLSRAEASPETTAEVMAILKELEGGDPVSDAIEAASEKLSNRITNNGVVRKLVSR